MDALIKLLNSDLFKYLGAVTAFLSGLYTLCLVIPGDQPDKVIKKILDITEKLSLK